MLPTTLDVLVIGAGQAGLAVGYHLRTTGLRYLIVDRHPRVGESWRARFDTLELFTPRAYSALPGLAVTGDSEGYPTKDEIADYLESYAAQFDLPIALNSGIAQLKRQDDRFQATTTRGTVITTRAVVIATGAFEQPAVPALAAQLDASVVQLTPDTYRNPAQIPAGTVLVVGDGATGRQIARELSSTHQVLLSTGRSRRVSPNRILGKNVFWWLDRLGLLRATRESRIGRRLMAADPFPGKHLELDRLRDAGISIVGRLEQIRGRQVMFADGPLQTQQVDAVIWATGYRDQTDWVAIREVIDANSQFIQHRGISPVPQLLFVGRSWQWTRGSALLAGVGDDAAYVTHQLVAELATVPPLIDDAAASTAMLMPAASVYGDS